MDNYVGEYVDLSQTHFNKLFITEEFFGDYYEYHGSVDVDIKYRDDATNNKRLNRTLRDSTLKYKNRALYNTHKERPDYVKEMITEEDEKNETVDSAIEDYINQNITKPGLMLMVIQDIFGLDLGRFVLENAYNSGSMIVNNGKVKHLEFDYRKSEIKSIWIEYENGSHYTVELPQPVSNLDCDAVVPDMTLVELYTNFDNWLEEDYEGTIEIANEIFGINLETLEGGQVK